MLEITQLTYTAIIGFLIVVILGPIFIPMLAKQLGTMDHKHIYKKMERQQWVV